MKKIFIVNGLALLSLMANAQYVCPSCPLTEAVIDTMWSQGYLPYATNCGATMDTLWKRSGAGLLGWNLFGNVSSPAYFLGYTDGANALKFRTNNVERMRISSTGNVGIGTVSPTKLLQVGGYAGYKTSTPILDSLSFLDSLGALHLIKKYGFDSTHCFTKLKIDSVVACSPLYLNGTSLKAVSTGNMSFVNTAHLDGFGITSDTAVIGSNNNTFEISPSKTIFKNTTGSGVHVGIATTAPDTTYVLDVNGRSKFDTVANYKKDYSSGYTSRSFVDSSFVGKVAKSFSSLFDWKLLGNVGTNSGVNFLGTIDTAALTFRTNNSEQMRLLFNGDFGVGNINPSSRLDVFSSGNAAKFKTSGNYNNAFLVSRTDDAAIFQILGTGTTLLNDGAEVTPNLHINGTSVLPKVTGCLNVRNSTSSMGSFAMAIYTNDTTLILGVEEGHYLILPSIPSYSTNAAATGAGVPVGGVYYTDTAGERFLKVAYYWDNDFFDSEYLNINENKKLYK